MAWCLAWVLDRYPPHRRGGPKWSKMAKIVKFGVLGGVPPKWPKTPKLTKIDRFVTEVVARAALAILFLTLG